MYPKFNLFSNYEQFNHLHAPRYFDWEHHTKGTTGSINFLVDDYTRTVSNFDNGKPKVALLIEPRTIQPTIYEWVEQHHDEFDLIFTHDEAILFYDNAYPIFFAQWYKSYDVPKTKNISMVCSDKIMCEEHKARQQLADTLQNRVDHYGMYRGGRRCDYYECRAEYMFEVVVDNNWTGHWVSEKLMNPLASKTIPIYLGGKHLPDWIEKRGIIIAKNIYDIPRIVDEILKHPEESYNKRKQWVDKNFETLLLHSSTQVFEDWLWVEYKDLLEDLVNEYNISRCRWSVE